MRIGHITLANRLFAAPMAGVTDRPFRQLCKRLGAGYAVSEMVTSRKDLWTSLKTSRRADHDGETGTDLGADRRHRRGDDGRGRRLQHRPRRADHRHQHGLPGQEGLQQVGRLGADEGRIARARDRRGGGRRVRAARRAGDAEDAHRLVASEKNAVRIARAAEHAGIAMVTVHGRTREQGYKGERRVRHRRRGQARGRASRWSPTATSTRRRSARVLARPAPNSATTPPSPTVAGLALFPSGDDLCNGAALNVIQIAETLRSGRYAC